MAKTFILDTNVLLHDAECIESFADNTVILPMAVIEELDRFKTRNDELGRHARQVIRRLDALRKSGSLRDGVPLASGGLLRILSSKTLPNETGLDDAMADNRILRVAFALHRAGEQVIFISKDINARIKADALGLASEDFERQKVNFDEMFTGYSEQTVPGSLVDEFMKTDKLEREGLGAHPNAFLMLRDENDPKHNALARVVRPGTLTHLQKKYDSAWNIQSRNREQRLALELLLNPSVQIVTLLGQAGTGKTLLALAAGLHAVLNNHSYDGILVSRPVVPMGKDIGYLPGAKEEKLVNWMQPIFDNLTYLLRKPDSIPVAPSGKKKTKVSAQDRVRHLLDRNVLALEALTYIRGRSIPNQYVIVDEAQNLTPHEVKTIISRSGEYTKMVLTGDPYQIDNPYLDASSNGLTYAAERLKDQTLHGHVTLRSSERSKLAAIAAEHL